MATTIEDESQGTLREERVYVPLPETERARQVRSPSPRYEEAFVFPLGPRIRWGGIVAGVVAAFAVIFLCTVLGIAIGLSTLASPLLLNAETFKAFATTAGVWTGVFTLIAYFVAGLVSTKVTDRPDGGAVLHGTLAWLLLSVTSILLATSGLVLGLGRLPERMLLSLNGFVLPSLNRTVLTEAELAQRLGLTDPSAVMARLSDERLISALTAATQLSQEEAKTTLNDLRARVSAVQNDLDAINAEMRDFLSRLRARAQQQAPAIAEYTQRQVQKGSWMTFAIMAVTLLVTIIGSYTGLPHSQRGHGFAIPRL